jgi:hypothetical protein
MFFIIGNEDLYNKVQKLINELNQPLTDMMIAYKLVIKLKA